MPEREKKPKITNKVVLFIVILLALSNAIIGIMSFILHRDQSIHARSAEAGRVAETLALSINGDRFERIMKTLEKDDYWYEVQSVADSIATNFGTAYLYILDKDYDNEVTYFAQGTSSGDGLDLGEGEDASFYADEMYGTISSGKPSVTEPYSLGGYGTVVSGYAPILNSNGNVVGVVGIDFFFDDVVRSVNTFGWTILSISVVFLIICSVFGFVVGNKTVGVPLTALDEAAKQMSDGDMDISLDIQTKSEIGRLAKSFEAMVAGTKRQIDALETLAQGDLTVKIEPRSEADTMGHAMIHMVKSIHDIFVEIRESSERVSSGSSQIAGGAQALSQGSTQQAASIEELSESINQVAVQTTKNAAMAKEAAGLSNSIKDNAEQGSTKMGHMMDAVRDINEASNSIGKVIKVIDDIAFQTNILALNAAVEAARAGQHGKGFAVVAEEVRNLAAKSAEAAKDTGSMIANSIKKAKLGYTIAEETSESLTQIVEGINKSTEIVNQIAISSDEQANAIEQINTGINQVADVVHQNTATAEESASVSQQMNQESVLLHDMIGRFKID